jgi:hypothetical protein
VGWWGGGGGGGGGCGVSGKVIQKQIGWGGGVWGVRQGNSKMGWVGWRGVGCPTMFLCFGLMWGVLSGVACNGIFS